MALLHRKSGQYLEASSLEAMDICLNASLEEIGVKALIVGKARGRMWSTSKLRIK